MATNAWTGGAANGIWSSDGNWSLGRVPAAGDAVVVAGSDAISGGTSEIMASYDFSGYTGTYDVNGSGLFVTDSVTLSAGMTVTSNPGITINNFGTAVITTAGQPIYQVICQDPATDLTFADDITIFGQFWQEPSCASALTINQGTKKITLATSLPGGYGFFIEGAIGVAAWNYSAGAQIICAPLTTIECQLELPASLMGGKVPPPLVLNGAGYVDWITEALPLSSLSVLAGELRFTTLNLSTTGAATLTGGTITGLSGRTVTIGGNFSDTAVDLTDGTWHVAGTAAAHTATLTTCSFAGGTELDATDGCTDGGGTTNVDFGSAVTIAAPGCWAF